MHSFISRTFDAGKRLVANTCTAVRDFTVAVVEQGKALVIGGTTAIVAGAVASDAHAGSGPPPMPDIEFPIEPATIVAKFVQFGGLVLGLIFAVSLGFILAKKLFWNTQRAV